MLKFGSNSSWRSQARQVSTVTRPSPAPPGDAEQVPGGGE